MDYHPTEGRCSQVFVHEEPQQRDVQRRAALMAYCEAKESKTRIPQFTIQRGQQALKLAGIAQYGGDSFLFRVMVLDVYKQDCDICNFVKHELNASVFH